MTSEEITLDQTTLGFEDITPYLNKDSSIQIQKHDIIRNIYMDSVIEEYHGQEKVNVGNFFSRDLGIRGRVFTFDELLEPGTTHDLIVQNFKTEQGFPKYNLDTQVYHDFYNHEELIVYAQRKNQNKDPSFLLFNRIRGFIHKEFDPYLYEDIKKGDLISVQVERLHKRQNNQIVLIARPLEILEYNNN
jgi:hypothetical protein